MCLTVAQETLLIIRQKAALSDAVHEQLQNGLRFGSERAHKSGARLALLRRTIHHDLVAEQTNLGVAQDIDGPPEMG